jgi:hypothetical protein
MSLLTELAAFFRLIYKDFAPPELGIGIPMNLEAEAVFQSCCESTPKDLRYSAKPLGVDFA